MLKTFVVLAAAVLVSIAVTPRPPVRVRLASGRGPLPPTRLRPTQDDLLLN